VDNGTPGIPKETELEILITLAGACVEVVSATRHPSPSHGFVSYFELLDRSGSSETAYISVKITYQAVKEVKDFESKEMSICLNAIRRELDRGTITFYGSNTHQECAQEIKVLLKDIASPPAPASDTDVQAYLLHRAYWEGYKLSDDPDLHLLEFAMPRDLEYLGVDDAAVARAVWFLAGEGLLQKFERTVARLTPKLVTMYQSKRPSGLREAVVFPKGTPFESLRSIQQVLHLATRSITVVDNFMDESLLDLVAAVPSHISIRILSFKVSPSFRVALTAFKGQYAHRVEIRTHDRDVHDRAIIIDESRCFSLGASIKDAGSKLWIQQELKDSQAIQKLRHEIDGVWSASKPL
jgi:hypothetical protein